jgi:hypothetical protein
MPEFADEVREVAVRENGRVGEGSRDARGDGAAEDEVEVAEGCDVSLGGPDSVIGVTVAVLADESRESVGCAFRLVVIPSDGPGGMLGDLSISACGRGCWLSWLEGEKARIDQSHACHTWPIRAFAGRV